MEVSTVKTFFIEKRELISILNQELSKHEKSNGAEILPRHINLLGTVNPKLFKWDIRPEECQSVGACEAFIHEVLPQLREKYILHLR